MIDIRPGDTVFGSTLDEKYRVVNLIGGGQFGLVYEVLDEDGGRLALKTILTANLDSRNLQALENEGRLATEVKHDNVVRVFFFHDGKRYPQLPPYMLMEFADAGTLGDLIERRAGRREPFTVDELRAIFLQLASGMKAISEKLVHRDIKPDNILVFGDRLRISDFGLSKVVGAATRSRTFKGINHIMYCAPEAWRVEENTPAMDMYSMGIVFYETASLRHPFEVQSSGDIVEAWKNAHFVQVPADPPVPDLGLRQLIMKMMSKRPADRYGSWEEVIRRVRSRSDQSSDDLDVQPLVMCALADHRRREEARVQALEKQRLMAECRQLVEHCFKEIVRAGQSMVESFNSQSDVAKLELVQHYPLAFQIRRRGMPRPIASVGVAVTSDHLDARLDGHRIKAWGEAKAPSGKGFNLLLVETAPDDLYGRWHAFHAGYNAWAKPSVRTRPEPFPFDSDELPAEIALLDSMHIHEVARGEFTPAMLVPLIEELF